MVFHPYEFAYKHSYHPAVTVWPKSIWIKGSGWWQNTTTASKYRICINWNPPFQTQIYIVNSKKYNFSKFFESLQFFLLYNTKKKLNTSCSLDFSLFPKEIFVSLKKLLLKFYEVRSNRGDFNWCWFWAS